MKIEYYVIEDAIETALRTAIVADAFPKFAAEMQNGATEASATGTFWVPIGHYFKLPPLDYILEVAVSISGKVFPYEGGMFTPAGGEFADKVANALKCHTNSKDLRAAVGPCTKIREMAAVGGVRYSINADATLVIRSRPKTVDELQAEKQALSTNLADLQTGHNQALASLNATYEQQKQQLETQHTQALAQITDNDQAKVAKENIAFEQRKQQVGSNYTQQMQSLQSRFERKKSDLEAEIAIVDKQIADAGK